MNASIFTETKQKMQDLKVEGKLILKIICLMKQKIVQKVPKRDISIYKFNPKQRVREKQKEKER